MSRIFISAGEASGDLHGAALVRALRNRQPEIQIDALGGPLMRQAGATLVDDITAHAVVGLIEGIRSAARIYGTFRAVVETLRRQRPDGVVLIDFPEFNLRLAKHAKRLGIPVIYYISPQVWAWRRWRVNTIRRHVDRMLVIFPFEVEFYREHGVQAEFVGHPLVGALADVPEKTACRAALGVPAGAAVIGLLPGSRRKEVEAILPIIAQAGRLIRNGLGRPVHFLLARAGSVGDQPVRRILDQHGLDAQIVSGDTCRVMRACDLLLVASGTATVEAMIIGTPMAVVYRVSPVTYALFIHLMRVAHYAMVNIIAGRRIVPEFIQAQARPDRPLAYLAMTEHGSAIIVVWPDRAEAALSDFAEAELNALEKGANLGRRLGLHVNAGHGLNYHNTLALTLRVRPEELHIGHSIISRAVFSGLAAAVRDMKAICDEASRIIASRP